MWEDVGTAFQEPREWAPHPTGGSMGNLPRLQSPCRGCQVLGHRFRGRRLCCCSVDPGGQGLAGVLPIPNSVHRTIGAH